MPEILPDHPAELLERLNRLMKGPFDYEFSKYVYVPQSTKDDREYLRVPSLEAAGKVDSLLGSLKAHQELALHSRLFRGSEVLHIPMLDLDQAFSDTHLAALNDLMREFGVSEFAVYNSGRSAHVYGLGLLSAERLNQFFARALLLNLPGKKPIVDARWIGHRLYAGYGSLRWSCNTKQYLGAPKAIGIFRS
ncbi:MAG: hypothetical protein AB7K68_11230 [Bacteriovoracia bacterium]